MKRFKFGPKYTAATALNALRSEKYAIIRVAGPKVPSNSSFWLYVDGVFRFAERDSETDSQGALAFCDCYSGEDSAFVRDMLCGGQFYLIPRRDIDCDYGHMLGDEELTEPRDLAWQRVLEL